MYIFSDNCRISDDSTFGQMSHFHVCLDNCRHGGGCFELVLSVLRIDTDPRISVLLQAQDQDPDPVELTPNLSISPIVNSQPSFLGFSLRSL